MAKIKTTSTAPAFIGSFLKDSAKIEGVSTTAAPPRYWHSFGNHVVNAVMSGEYDKGIAQGRITGIVGPSGAGKSFLVGNLVKSAQEDGSIILVVDSENALDDDYMGKIGCDTSPEAGYYYRGVSTVSQVIKIVSSFIKGYRAQYGDDENAPHVLIAIDSLNMLQTDSSAENYEKGVQKGDQGQKAKQVKAMLLDFVQDIKGLNIAMVVTGHVYKNTDLLNGEGTYIVNDGMRFSLSQIVLVTKLKLRDKATKEFEGIQMKVFGFKTRFTKPFQSVTIEVPYDSGIDKYSGLLDVAKAQGIVTQSGSRYTLKGETTSWFSKDFNERAEAVLAQVMENKTAILSIDAALDDEPEATE